MTNTGALNIGPGTPLMIILGTDLKERKVHAVGSMLHEVEGRTMVIGQTEPRLPASMLDREVTITFLSTERNRTSRYGFRALIREYVERSPALSAPPIDAIIAERRTEPRIHNMRMSYRVQPTEDSRLSMTMDGQVVNVIDISVGGARLRHSASSIRPTGSRVKLNLDIDGKVYPLDARIVSSSVDAVPGTDHGFASAQFLNLDAGIKSVLSKKIREVAAESGA